MRYIVELETADDRIKTQDQWALFLLKCICAFLSPEGVRAISVSPAEPADGAMVQ